MFLRAVSEQHGIATQMIVLFLLYLTNIHPYQLYVKLVLLWEDSTGPFRATIIFSQFYF
jgi:hypothetical protein